MGDRVVGECVIGQDHFGFSISGAAAEFFVAKESWLHRLPDNLSWTQGALVEPFSCGYYATVRADNLDASDTAIVLGAGPIGLGVVAAAAGKGARVIVAEPTPDRGDLARTLGADEVLDPTSDTFHDEVEALTAGAGASVVFEASGKLPAMAMALEVAAFRARLVYIGIDVGGIRAGPAGPVPVQGAPGPGHHRIAGSLAADAAVPLPQRGRPVAAGDRRRTRCREADEAVEAVLRDRAQVKVHISSDATL